MRKKNRTRKNRTRKIYSKNKHKKLKKNMKKRTNTRKRKRKIKKKYSKNMSGGATGAYWSSPRVSDLRPYWIGPEGVTTCGGVNGATDCASQAVFGLNAMDRATLLQNQDKEFINPNGRHPNEVLQYFRSKYLGNFNHVGLTTLRNIMNYMNNGKAYYGIMQNNRTRRAHAVIFYKTNDGNLGLYCPQNDIHAVGIGDIGAALVSRGFPLRDTQFSIIKNFSKPSYRENTSNRLRLPGHLIPINRHRQVIEEEHKNYDDDDDYYDEYNDYDDDDDYGDDDYGDDDYDDDDYDDDYEDDDDMNFSENDNNYNEFGNQDQYHQQLEQQQYQQQLEQQQYQQQLLQQQYQQQLQQQQYQQQLQQQQYLQQLQQQQYLQQQTNPFSFGNSMF